MFVLGVSCFSQDAAAALLRDGELIAAAEEERFTRRAHENGYPRHAIEFCLRTGGIPGRALDLVVFFEKPLRKMERVVSTAAAAFPSSRAAFRDSMPELLRRDFWIRRRLASHLRIPQRRIVFSEHQLSHAASAFFCSPFDNAAILTVDGAGEWATASFGIGHGNALKLIGEIRYPNSLGLLYRTFAAFLGFPEEDGEHRVMALAGYGRPRHLDKIWKVVNTSRDGSFHLNLDYFSFHRLSRQLYSEKFVELFGSPRSPAMRFCFARNGAHPGGAGTFDASREARLSEYYADVAASVQAVTEDLVLRMAKYARQCISSTRLCLAGAIASNCLVNARIARESGFDEVFIQPAPGDAGGALGAALWGYHCVEGQPRAFTMRHPYWGEQHSFAAAADYVRASGAPHRILEDESKLLDCVTDALARGAIVAWMQGRFEWGSRTMGNRSILADPRRAATSHLPQTGVKFRDGLRPFAAAVRSIDFAQWFEAGMEPHPASSFGLLACRVPPGRQERIPGAVHVDRTACAHAISEEHNPIFHRLLGRFGEATGVPILLNTSLSRGSEPIVNTPAEAMCTFRQSAIDLLVVGNTMVGKSTAVLAA